jgi:FKBP-type peptidyl-prolyl cis-trans isomerase SlyD
MTSQSRIRDRTVNIAADSVVTLTYKLYSAQGKLIEESAQPIVYIHGGHHGIFPKIEAALAQKQAGDHCSVTLEPDDAFGEYDADLVRVESEDRFPDDVKVGMQFEEPEDEGGEGGSRVFTVTDIAQGKVVIDGNHPLAGQRLRFDCTVVEVRAATAEEIAHGHVHGPDGHHH